MKLGESLEDYLETLYILEQSGHIRCVDVATKLGVSKPSVNKAMNVLKEKGFVHQKSYGEIFLTDEGREVAIQVYRRHQTLFSFLKDMLGVSCENAEVDACHIEHVISEETFEKLLQFIDNCKH